MHNTDRIGDGLDRFSRRGKSRKEEWSLFASHLAEYISADFADPATYANLGIRLADQGKSSARRQSRTVSPFGLPTPCAEPGVAPNSSRETFAAIKLFVDNWR